MSKDSLARVLPAQPRLTGIEHGAWTEGHWLALAQMLPPSPSVALRSTAHVAAAEAVEDGKA